MNNKNFIELENLQTSNNLNYSTKNLHIIGLGGGGSASLEYIYKKGIRANFTSIHKWKLQTQDINYIQYIPNGQLIKIKDKEYLFSDWSVKFEMPKEIISIFNKNEKYALIAGLGGYTGTNMVEYLTKMLYEQKFDFLTICSLPFRFEGKTRRCVSKDTIQKIENIPNFRYFDLESIRNVHGNLQLCDAFKIADNYTYSILTNYL